MALIVCPDCEKEVSDKAAACIHCGCPLKQEEPKKLPAGSVGKCPACGSYNTVDRIAKQRRRGGFMQALGARVGSGIAGHGRYGCLACKHTWEFGQNI